MTVHDPADGPVYTVVINDEQQYSLWPASTSIPDGWHAVGVEGSQQACLQHIESVWADMRPLSAQAR